MSAWRITREGDRALLEAPSALPLTDVWHRRPRLGWREGLALLQELDRDPVRRANEGHVAIPRRSTDRHSAVHQLLTARVDVLDLVGEVAEVTPPRVLLGVPVMRQLDLRELIARRSQV